MTVPQVAQRVVPGSLWEVQAGQAATGAEGGLTVLQIAQLSEAGGLENVHAAQGQLESVP